MNKKEERLFGLACFLGGVVAGFLIAPIKKGVYCGNNNGHTVMSMEELDELDKKAKEDSKEHFNEQ